MLSFPQPERMSSHQSYLWFLESLDRINRSIQESNDLEDMLMKSLDTMLEIFECDRAWMCNPCDPHAATWCIPLERTKPEWPGGFAIKADFPMTPEIARVHAKALTEHKPIMFGPEHEDQLLDNITEQFSIRSIICTAVFPKVGKPWMLGLHQCSYARYWTPEEQRLFQEIGRRLSDGLSSFITYRNLLLSEEKYRCIVETASEGILAIDADARISFVNPRVANMLGYSMQELIGRNLSELVHPDELANHEQRVSARKNGQTETFERRVIRKDGTTVWILCSATPQFDEAGKFKGAFGMLADITALKIAEKQLTEAKEAAEHAVQMKTRFMDIAAHELRTPVTALSLFIELAQEEGGFLPPDYLTRMQKQASRLNRLVVELLDVARLDRGSMKLSREPVDMAELIEDCIEDFRLQFPKRLFTFNKSFSPVIANVDKVRIQQVIANLLDNACNYTPEDASIEIKLRSVANRVRVEVADRGEGIPFDLQLRLFKPLERGSSDHEERSSGLGLGLPVSEGIIKLHGGRIGFFSEAGEGSTFFFELSDSAT